jgi:hypothetical protein
VIKAAALRPGDICAFRTSPINSFSEASTGRQATPKVLTTGNLIVYIVLEGVFAERPQLQHVAHQPVLLNERFSFNGTPALHSTSRSGTLTCWTSSFSATSTSRRSRWRSSLGSLLLARGAPRVPTPKASGDGGRNGRRSSVRSSWTRSLARRNVGQSVS